MLPFSKQNKQDPYLPFYAWLIITGLITFGMFLLWRFDLLAAMLDADQTRLSLIIIMLFGLTCIYLGRASWRLARQGKRLKDGMKDHVVSTHSENTIDEYLYLSELVKDNDSGYEEALHARLVERIHRGHQLGWFAVDALIRLGLIGTVIGFILMLSTVYQLQNDDVSALQKLLGSMGAGMQVALYTTLTGISSSLLLSVYCKALDHYADNLVGDVIRQSVIAGVKPDKSDTAQS